MTSSHVTNGDSIADEALPLISLDDTFQKISTEVALEAVFAESHFALGATVDCSALPAPAAMLVEAFCIFGEFFGVLKESLNVTKVSKS